MTLQERFRGCLIGGAIGDALGYPIEFLGFSDIQNKYGSAGLTDLETEGSSGTAIISDDTQMTLFTASGLLWAKHRIDNRGIGGYIESGIYPSYMRWLYTQDHISRRPAFLKEQAFERDGVPNIMDVKALFACRAPGNTCLSALESGCMGEMESPINNSKGCGGVMRVAPIGLFLHHTPYFAFGTAAKAAAITHGHPSGYLSAGVLSSIIANLVNDKSLIKACEDSIGFLQEFVGHEELSSILKLTLDLVYSSISPEKAIEKIGLGWVGEEALAIALYCVLKETDPRTALLLSVNHDGDSDSTGAICGNILGAMYGLPMLPEEWTAKVEIKDFIIAMADALYKETVSRTQ